MATLSLIDLSFLLFLHTLTLNTASATANTNAATEIPATAPPESPATTCLDAKPSKNPGSEADLKRVGLWVGTGDGCEGTGVGIGLGSVVGSWDTLGRGVGTDVGLQV